MKNYFIRISLALSPVLFSGCTGADVLIAAAPGPALTTALVVELANAPIQPVQIVDQNGQVTAGPTDQQNPPAAFAIAPASVVCVGNFKTPTSKNGQPGRVRTKCSNGLIGQVRILSSFPHGSFTFAGSTSGSQHYEESHTLECNAKLSVKQPIQPFLTQCFDIADTPTVRPTLLGNGTYAEYEKSEKRIGAAAVSRISDTESELTVWINPEPTK